MNETNRKLTRVLKAEVWVVLGLTLAKHAWYALLAIVDRLTRQETLANQKVVMNPSVAPERGWLDASYKLTDLLFGYLVPVILVVFLVSVVYAPKPTWKKSLGFGEKILRNLPKDFLPGFGLAALIGLPGLGFYLLAKNIGINATVVASGMQINWWTVVLLILAGVGAGVYEETILLGYLFARWTQRNIPGWKMICWSALIRGSYHLYQGFGAFIGNIVMGAVFGLFYTRSKRVMPFIIAHALIDIVAFVGYSLLATRVSWL